MSASNPNSAIYISDTPSQIKNKIKRIAFSGGGSTAQIHKEHGANLQVDVSYQYLKFFMDDDVEFERIEKAYASGEMSTSEIKQICTEVLTDLVTKVQQVENLVEPQWEYNYAINN